MKTKKEPEVEVENNEENPLQLSHPASNIELYFDEATECIRVVDEDVNDGYEIDLKSITAIYTETDIDDFVVPDVNKNGVFTMLKIECQFEGKEDPSSFKYLLSEEKCEEIFQKWHNWTLGINQNKPETKYLDVHCLNDDENRKRIAGLIMELINDNFDHESAIENIRSISSSHRENIKQNNERLKQLRDEYEAEFVNRHRECLVVKNFEQGVIQFTHPETGEVFETREMTLSDRQQQLEFEKKESGEQVTEDGEQGSGDRVQGTGSEEVKAEIWWEFFIDPLKDSAHAVDVRQYYKNGLTDKRMKKIKPAMINDPRYLELVKDLNKPSINDEQLNACAKKFYEIAYGLMIDTGIVK